MKKDPKCKNCWDKGYSTQLIGNTVTSANFYGQDGIIVSSYILKNYCKCAKGKRMKGGKT